MRDINDGEADMSEVVTYADTPMSDEGSDEPFYVVRPGTWFLVPPPGGDDENAGIVQNLVNALRADTRVLDVQPPMTLNDYWTSRFRAYPDRARGTAGGLLTGNDAFHGLELSHFLQFRVRVPIKNQEPHHGADDIPSDTYLVAWNGVSIFVLWEQTDDWIPISGGHVVESVLRDVLESIDCELYVQACGPGCDYGFLHTSIVVDPAVCDDFLLERRDARSVAYMGVVPFDDPSEGLGYLAVCVGPGVGTFADYKNIGRRIIDMERSLRVDLAQLLMHYHKHATLVSHGNSPKMWRERFRARKWRKDAWELISAIWLGMANVETLRRQWREERASMLNETETLALLERDFVRDGETIDALEMQPIAETVNQVAAALNNRMAVTATLWGALAGGLAGGAAGILGQ